MTMAVIGATFVAYLAEVSAIRGAADPELTAVGLVRQWGLCREGFRWWQPVTYLLMHDPSGVMHLLGNMVFLWVFGSVTESRMGRAGFLAFYVSGGVAAGLLQVWDSPSPVIGASGAVAATSGAFIALYPRGRVLVWFLLSAVNMPALLLVGLYFALDLLGAFGAGPGNIGHMAHVGGTVFGVAVTLALVATGLVRRTDMDMLFLLKRWIKHAACALPPQASEAALEVARRPLPLPRPPRPRRPPRPPQHHRRPRPRARPRARPRQGRGCGR